MDKQKQKEFMQKVVHDVSASMSSALVHLGVKTGLFVSMYGKGPMALDAIVSESGLQERYVKEWANGMVAAGYLEYDPDGQTYELPPEHGLCFGDPELLQYMGGLFYALPEQLSIAPKLVEAFKNGGGVSFAEFGEDVHKSIELMNKGPYNYLLTKYWIPAVPEIHGALENGGRALDIGCGRGLVPLNLAKGYTNASFVGLDVHQGSIDAASEQAIQASVQDRVEFVTGTVGDLPPEEKFDMISFMDVVHDLAAPEETLAAARNLLADGGTVFVVEPNVAANVEDNRNPIAALFYGMSMFHCMTQSLSQGGPGLGACFGPAGLETLARDVGFTEFRKVEIPSPMNVFYALRG